MSRGGGTSCWGRSSFYIEGPNGSLRPALPAALRTPGARYAVHNLNIRGAHFDLTYGVLSATEVQIGVRRREAGTVTVAGQGSATLAFEFAGRWEETYQVTLD